MREQLPGRGDDVEAAAVDWQLSSGRGVPNLDRRRRARVRESKAPRGKEEATPSLAAVRSFTRASSPLGTGATESETRRALRAPAPRERDRNAVREAALEELGTSRAEGEKPRRGPLSEEESAAGSKPGAPPRGVG